MRLKVSLVFSSKVHKNAPRARQFGAGAGGEEAVGLPGGVPGAGTPGGEDRDE